jgi:hypothetical protein
MLNVTQNKKKIIKNLIGFYLSFMLIFASSSAIISIQSVLYSEGNLGIYSQLTVFSFQIPIAIILPTIFIDTFGHKNTMLIVELGFTAYVASNFYPRLKLFISLNYQKIIFENIS